jgi:hypothetical protein
MSQPTPARESRPYIGASIPRELKVALFREAARHDRSASAEIRIALRHHLGQDDPDLLRRRP